MCACVYIYVYINIYIHRPYIFINTLVVSNADVKDCFVVNNIFTDALKSFTIITIIMCYATSCDASLKTLFWWLISKFCNNILEKHHRQPTTIAQLIHHNFKLSKVIFNIFILCLCCSRQHLKKKLSRKSMICWRATWALETVNLVCFPAYCGVCTVVF